MQAKGGRIDGEVPAMLTREMVNEIRFKTLKLLTEHNYFYEQELKGAILTAGAKRVRELTDEEVEQISKEVIEDLKKCGYSYLKESQDS